MPVSPTFDTRTVPPTRRQLITSLAAMVASASTPGWAATATVATEAQRTKSAPTSSPAGAADRSVRPLQRLSPGGIARIALGPSAQRPKAAFEGKPVLVVGEPAGWTAVVGLDLSAKLGRQELVVQRPDQPNAPDEVKAFELMAYPYREQRLNVSPSHVDLSPENQARAAREL